MINILMSGCNGKMGQVISKIAKEKDDMQIVAGFDKWLEIENEYPTYDEFSDIEEKVDVIIDFTNPSLLEQLLDYAVGNSIPLIYATTGFSEEDKDNLIKASAKIPVLLSANMSLGVNLLIELVKQAAVALEGNFDIEVVEKHHNQKIDAPSGTALAIADAMNEVLEQKCAYVYDRQPKRERRTKTEIGMHAIRGGTITGEHDVIFAGNDEIITISHSAVSKNIFGEGSLKAAKYMVDAKNGFYAMKDVLNL